MKTSELFYRKINALKRILCIFNVILAAMSVLCGCDMDYSSDSTSQTEESKKVRCIVTVEYDETLKETLFGSKEKYYITLDGEDIGTVSSRGSEGSVEKETYLTVGTHTVKAECSKEKLFDFNSVSFDVKDTDGLYTAELKMRKGSLELVRTHVYEQKNTEVPPDVTVSLNMDDYVKTHVSVVAGISNIPDIFSHDYQSFTVYIDGHEVATLDQSNSSYSDLFYLEKGTHKISIRKNNTDDYDYSFCTFDVDKRTTELYFTISHNQLLDTFSIKQND